MKEVKIKSIKKINKKLDRYDLTVSSTNNFYANGILIHNTSGIFSNILVKKPKWNGLYEKLFLYLPKFLQFTVEGYDKICSSRTVIINDSINPNRGEGFAGGQVQKTIETWLGRIGEYIPEGVTLYGEIVGYYEGSNTPIQKFSSPFDYGSKPGENQLMIYRVTEMVDGVKQEWNIEKVRMFTIGLADRLESEGKLDIAKRIRPIDTLYHGTLKDLYPDLDVENHWHENLLAKMKVDERFGMEKQEPFCKNKVPREGIVIRLVDDPVSEAFKLKCISFLSKEADKMDKGEVDEEMIEGYA